MVVDLVAKTGVTDLVHPFELIETDGIPIGHDEPMKRDGESRLTEGVHALRFSQDLCAGRNQNVLAVVRVEVVGNEALDRVQ